MLGVSEHVFACGCGRAVQADFVEGVIPGGKMAMGASVIISFRCECTPEQERVRRYYAVPDAVERVTRGRGLPYRNPSPLIPVPGDHPDMKMWRESLRKYGGDADAFIAALDSR